MESIFQYRRIHRAVREELSLIKEKCDCPDYIVGSTHRIRYVSVRLMIPSSLAAILLTALSIQL